MDQEDHSLPAVPAPLQPAAEGAEELHLPPPAGPVPTAAAPHPSEFPSDSAGETPGAAPPAPETLAAFNLPPTWPEETAEEADPAIAAGRAAGYAWRRVWWPGFALAGAFLLVGAVLAFTFRGPVRDFMLASLEVLPFAPLPLLAYLGVRRMWARVASFLCLGALVWGMAGFVVLMTLLNMGPGSFPGAVGISAWGLAEGGRGGGLVPGRDLAFHPGADRGRAPVAGARNSHRPPLSRTCGGAFSRYGGHRDAARPSRSCSTGVRRSSHLSRPIPPSPGSRAPGRSRCSTDWCGPCRPASSWRDGRWSAPGERRWSDWDWCGPPSARWRRRRNRIAAPRGDQSSYAGVGWIFHAAGWPRTHSNFFEQLLGPAMSRWGAVAVGVSAGLGEELIFRGALQPQLGILLSALSSQPPRAAVWIRPLLDVLLMAGAGVVRLRANTTTSAIVHGVYDFALLFAAALGFR